MAFDFAISLRAALGILLTFAALGTAVPATAQQPSQDPPARIARLNVHEGTVSFSPAGEDDWYDVVPNRPLTSGDRLWTDRAARAEVFVGSAAVRTDAQTSLEFTRIDDATVQLTLSQGSLDLHLRDDLDGQRFEVDTGNLALSILAPGDYRIDADPATGTTRVAVAAGSATVYGENGTAVPIGERQQITVSGRDLAAADTRVPSGAAAFDRWVGERNRIEERSVSARYVSRDIVGYQQLDAYGDWRNDGTYGDVWYPRNVAAGWAPYRDGQWVDVAPWGWTWIDAAPWGFAPSHYGRWARVGPRWGWVPGRRDARPVFAPALVGFVGGPGPTSGPGTGGRNGVGWFPLAPGERWQPGYRASQRYVEQANRTTIRIDRPQQRNDFYANQRIVEALTIVPAERFGRGPIDRRDFPRQRDDGFSRAPVAHAPPLTLAATVTSGAGGVRIGQALGALNARPAAAVPPPLLQPRAQTAQLTPIRPVQSRPQLAPAEGAALQQRQQQLQQIDQRREEQQQDLRRQQAQQQERQNDQRRAAAQQEQQRQDVRRQQENRTNAARDQQQRERQRDDEQRQAQQRQDQQRQAQREQDQRQQTQRMERDRQEQDRQTQYRQEQQRQQVQQQQRQAQQEQQQHAAQLRAQEQQLQQQRQQDRQQQQQQQSARLQEIQQSQERASQQRQFQQQQQQQQIERRQGEQRQGEQRDAERRNQQVREEQRRDDQRRQQQR